ncbi:MAG: AraC family transcriptional regulator [Verrucomicrobiota bacterium JB022]|nr:AraC family transcriptional regulator [Verrucomicrobiota bacterium JB022]
MHYLRMGFDLLVSDEVEIRNICVFENPPGWSWRSPGRPHLNLWIALEGEGVFSRAGEEIPFRAGSVFLLHPNEAVAGWSTGPGRVVNFTAHVVLGEGHPAWPEAYFAPRPPARLQPVAWVAHLCRHLSETFYLDREANRAILLQGLRLLLVGMERGRHQRALEPVERRLLRIVERIRRNPAADYSLDELAAEAELSISQFSRRFKTFTGYAPGRFAIEERISRAEAYLLETDLTIEAIAERLGYRDVYFFSRQFRRFRGSAPSDWRRRSGER